MLVPPQGGTSHCEDLEKQAVLYLSPCSCLRKEALRTARRSALPGTPRSEGVAAPTSKLRSAPPSPCSCLRKEAHCTVRAKRGNLQHRHASGMRSEKLRPPKSPGPPKKGDGETLVLGVVAAQRKRGRSANPTQGSWRRKAPPHNVRRSAHARHPRRKGRLALGASLYHGASGGARTPQCSAVRKRRKCTFGR